ncbi:MAG: DUF5655 domain-containing protein [Solirubrobacteraceae bacterium]
MPLDDTVTATLATAEKLKASKSNNEANTKALLIEPMLGALGWDPGDLDAVEREVKVFEGTFLDYALKLGGEPRVYVEAKGVGENLEDKKFVAQTVNYANNDGVVWCVLTNGIRYRIYKTNESAAMDKKLLLEVDLADTTETVSEKIKLLGLLSRKAVDAGELDQFGDRLFTDGRVRAALAALAIDPPPALMDGLSSELAHPLVPVDALKRSLRRILDAPEEKSAANHPVGPPQPPKSQEYELGHHLANKGALIHELFSEVNGHGIALGADVSRRIRKFYLAYFRGKRSFFTVELQQKRVLLYLSLDPATAAPWNDEAMRDARNFGHYGMGDVEYSLRSVDQVGEAKQLIKAAYDAG